MLTVKELKDLLVYCPDDMEVKIYMHNPEWKICNWYFGIEHSELKDDGLYIQLN